jgi:hypothetical protein
VGSVTVHVFGIFQRIVLFAKYEAFVLDAILRQVDNTVTWIQASIENRNLYVILFVD